MDSLKTVYENVLIAAVNENGQFTAKHQQPLPIVLAKSGSVVKIKATHQGAEQDIIEFSTSTEIARLGRAGIILTNENDSHSTLIKFQNETDCRKAHHFLKNVTTEITKNIFNERTDTDSATQYFQFYSYLSQQQNMMQDYVRTSTYQNAMLANVADFNGKVVLDVGAGSGILSFFAVQAGAKKVYAVEASNMAPFCEKLVKSNGLSGKIEVIPAKIEEVTLSEQVDTIISEPIGYMLFNERMLETYLHAKKFLKPGGKMFPTEGHLFIAPFQDEALFQEQNTKCNFWCQSSFHGINLTGLRSDSYDETLKQPIVDTFPISSCMATANKYPVNFLSVQEQDLYVIDVPLQFTMNTTGHIHGLAFWFDLAFIGSSSTVWLSTSPTEPLTHWYQVRCLLKESVFVNLGQIVTGRLVMRANARQSYDVEISVNIPGTNSTSTNVLDLKNPYFRYGAQVTAPPAQTSTVSPTEMYYAQNGYGQAMNGDINGMQHQPQNMSILAQQLNTTSIGSAPPINPGSIPAVGNSSMSQANRTSVGGGISPNAFPQGPVLAPQFGLSSGLMIGDYAATNMGQQKPNQ